MGKEEHKKKRGRGKGERKRRGEGGGVHTAEKKQKHNPAPPNYYTVAPAGKLPAGAPGGPRSCSAMAPCHKEGAIADRRRGGRTCKKPFLRFSNTSFWHYGAKPLKIGEQSYTFLIFFSKTAFSKSPRMFWEFGCCWNLWQPLLPLFFGGAQR